MMKYVKCHRVMPALLLALSLSLSCLAQSTKRFTLLDSRKTGIHFNNKVKDSRQSNILLYANFYGGAGVGVGDFNNDGLQDIYFAGNLVRDRLYFNRGDFKFEEVTKEAGILDDGGWATAVTVADVNNDGHLDIYVSRELYDEKPELRANLLYVNKGDGTFTERAKEFGVADSERTRGATFFDYDNDGHLDLFLLTQPPNPGNYSKLSGTVLLKPEYHLKLLRNTGNNSFVDVSKQAKIDLTGFPNAVSASDLNHDGWPDLYVANDFQAPDFLFLNNKDGTFRNVIDSAMMHIPYYSMGVDVADINNDELLDIFVVDMVAEDNFRLKSNMGGMNPEAFWKVVDDGGHYQYMYNSLQLNNGNKTFSDIAQISGMAATDWSWSNLLADFDNDGLKDAYITNGLLYDIRNTDADKKVGQYVTDTANKWVYENPDGGGAGIWDILDLDEAISLLPSQPLKNYAFKNLGKLEFQKVMGDWGMDQESFSNGSAIADFDNDGDLDIVVNNINEKAFVYRNNSEQFSGSNYLRIKLADKKKRPIFGAKTRLYSADTVQFFETTNSRGIYSTSEATVHFGLGSKMTIDSLVIDWPYGGKTIRYNISANQVLEIYSEESEKHPARITKEDASYFFKDVTGSKLPDCRHRENEFDDYQYQVLLPHKLSQLGPALAKGDVNGDGLEDIFVGAATGHEATLYVQNQEGGFDQVGRQLWQKEAAYEDVDAVFLDVNGDGYDDLYVVSGGNEYSVYDPHYVDRLYLNDGKGNFSKGAIINVDRMSGSKAVADDFDSDGDVDLFVGGRHIPHQYPLPASSMLLVNENGQLVNKTADLAGGLREIGMVTDALWDDYDADGDTDLILLGEWMPITVFDNENGKLRKSVGSGLENSTGWWFSIEKGDFDSDGDMDFIAGNLGLNYKYKTSSEAPFDIYYNDFDANGRGDIVLGYFNGEKHYPLRGFSCSSQQIPGLKDKIKKYDLFASLEIDEVYGQGNLENSLHYKADTFASSLVENLGNGKFRVSPLPKRAQISNINDFLVGDFNADNHLDMLVVGNLFVSEIETPRNDAGTGLLLVGNGKNGFETVTNIESGFFNRGDAKKLISVTIGEEQHILIANNNDTLRIFEIDKDEPESAFER